MRKKCPFYYELCDIISDRASVYLDADNNGESISSRNDDESEVDIVDVPAKSQRNAKVQKVKAAARTGAKDRLEDKIGEMQRRWMTKRVKNTKNMWR